MGTAHSKEGVGHGRIGKIALWILDYCLLYVCNVLHLCIDIE